MVLSISIDLLPNIPEETIYVERLDAISITPFLVNLILNFFPFLFLMTDSKKITRF